MATETKIEWAECKLCCNCVDTSTAIVTGDTVICVECAYAWGREYINIEDE